MVMVRLLFVAGCPCFCFVWWVLGCWFVVGVGSVGNFVMVLRWRVVFSGWFWVLGFACCVLVSGDDVVYFSV